MESDRLLKITNFLKTILEELNKLGIVDSKLRSRYAEYLVAYELAKRGHEVQLSTERKNPSADIYLADIQKRVEVKSGKYEKGLTDASFGKGEQIKKNKFDYCVFVTFDEFDESKVNEIFIFTKDELKEVVRHRRIAEHEKTNPCLLIRCQGGFNKFKEYMKKNCERPFKIEIALHKYPEKFDQAWYKIK